MIIWKTQEKPFEDYIFHEIWKGFALEAKNTTI